MFCDISTNVRTVMSHLHVLYTAHTTLYILSLFSCFPCLLDVEASSSTYVHTHVHTSLTLTYAHSHSLSSVHRAAISIFGYTECTGRSLLFQSGNSHENFCYKIFIFIEDSMQPNRTSRRQIIVQDSSEVEQGSNNP